MINEPIIGIKYKKVDEITDYFHILKRGFQNYIGINKCNLPNNFKVILIIANLNSLYHNKIEDNILYYSGQGNDKDQVPKRGNKDLMDNILPVYGVIKDKNNDFIYLGKLKLIESPKCKIYNDKKIYEFKYQIENDIPNCDVIQKSESNEHYKKFAENYKKNIK
ncbi:MAG: hypothetical protein PHN56_01885 [Candidatus Nanoarchaeia archaeon]|nr:hypothetical protein [Candidatus Nanoarchaeia archaeon]